MEQRNRKEFKVHAVTSEFFHDFIYIYDNGSELSTLPESEDLRRA